MQVEEKKYEEIKKAINSCCTAKNPKIQANCISLMLILLKGFGKARFNLLDYTGFVEKNNNSKNIFVKKELQEYYIAAMVWIGKGIKANFVWLQKTQSSDLDKAYEAKMQELNG